MPLLSVIYVAAFPVEVVSLGGTKFEGLLACTNKKVTPNLGECYYTDIIVHKVATL